MQETSNTNQPSIKKNFALSTAYQILAVLTPFITAPYVSRVLGANGIGIYSYTNSIQMYFSLFAALGIASYGNREIARKRDSAEERSKAFWEIQILKFFTSFICLLGWGVFIYFNEQYRIVYLVLTMSLFSIMFDISWFYTGLEQFVHIVARNTIVRLLELVLLFVLIRDKDDLVLYIALMSTGTLLGSLSMWISLPKFLVRVDAKAFKFKHHLKETIVYFVPTIASSIYTVLDKTLIGVITHNENENGYYEQANKILGIVKALVYGSLNSVLGSRIAYLFEEKKHEEIKQRIELSMNFIFFMGFGCCFGIIGIASNFVPLFFGAGYKPVIFLLQLLSPVVLIIGISNCLGSQYYTPAGLRGKSSIFIVIGSVVNIICNLILIPKLQSVGAAIGTLIAESLIAILYLIFCDGYFTIRQFVKCGWKKLLSAIVMLLVVLFVGRMELNPLLLIIIQIFAGAAVYCICLILLKDSFTHDFLFKRIKSKIVNKIESKEK